MKVKKALSLFTATMVLGSILVSTALASDAIVGQIKYYYVGTQQYANAAKVDVSGSGASRRVNGSTRISVDVPSGFADAGTIGASAELYDQYGNVVATAPRTVNDNSSNYCNSLLASINTQKSENYYATGFTYVWTGNSYDEEATYKTPLISSANSYSLNESGQTYGSAMFAESIDARPDLMAAVGNNGVSGYIYSAELEKENPKTPAEALAAQEMYDALITDWDGEAPIIIRTIPLYASDGKTVIGEYDISFMPSDDTWGW